MNRVLALLFSIFFCISVMPFFSRSSAAADYEYENSTNAPSSALQEPIRAQNLAISRIDEALALFSAMINDGSVTDQLAAKCNIDLQSVQVSILQAGESLQDGKVGDAKEELCSLVDLFSTCLVSMNSSSVPLEHVRKTLKQVTSCISNAEQLIAIGATSNANGPNDSSIDASSNDSISNDDVGLLSSDWEANIETNPNVDLETKETSSSLNMTQGLDKPMFIVEYCPDHAKLGLSSAMIRVDRTCGARLRSEKKYERGVLFSARIRAPVKGSGIITSFYVSSNDPSSDLISFDFIGKYPNRVLCSYSANGNSRGNQQLFVLPYDTSVDFHTYSIKWDSSSIEWSADNVLLRTLYKSNAPHGFPKKSANIFLHAWDASSIADGKYAGQVDWTFGPFTSYFSDLTVSGSWKEPMLNSDASSSLIPVPVRPLAIDYCFSNVNVAASDITLSYDQQRGCGGRFRSVAAYKSGTFIARFKCAAGDRGGLSSSFYLSSLQGNELQDEIDFKWLGKDKSSVQTNYYVNGVGGHEDLVALGFDCSHSFHTYTIIYAADQIQWLVDNKIVRIVTRGEVGLLEGSFPAKPVYLYGSVYNESTVDGDMPYTVYFSDVRVKSP